MTFPDTPGHTPRDTSRDTSREAAERITPHVSKLAADVLALIQANPSTCWEIEGQGFSHQTTSARIRELYLKGRIEDSGARRKTGSGRNAIVWAAVP